MTLRRVYLVLSFMGVFVPLFLIWQGMTQIDWDFSIARRDLDAFLVSVFGKVVLSGYFIAGLSLTVFMMYEANARSDYYLYWVLPFILTVGIGAALPFYLYLRMPVRE